MSAKVQVKLLATLTGHRQAVYSMVNGKKGLLSAGGDGFVVSWDYPKTEDGIVIAHCPEPIYALGLLETDEILMGSSSGALYWVKNGEVARKIVAHSKGIYAIEIMPNGYFLTLGGDGNAMVWNAALELLRTIEISKKALRCVVKIDKGFAVGASDNQIYIVDAELKVTKVFEGHTNSVFALAYNSESNTLYSGGRDAQIRSWDLNILKQKAPIAAHLLHIHSLKLSPDKSILASSSMDKTIKLWDSKSMELLKVLDKPKFEAHKSSVNTLLWVNDKALISGSDDRTVVVWERVDLILNV